MMICSLTEPGSGPTTGAGKMRSHDRFGTPETSLILGPRPRLAQWPEARAVTLPPRDRPKPTAKGMRGSPVIQELHRLV